MRRPIAWRSAWWARTSLVLAHRRLHGREWLPVAGLQPLAAVEVGFHIRFADTAVWPCPVTRRKSTPFSSAIRRATGVALTPPGNSPLGRGWAVAAVGSGSRSAPLLLVRCRCLCRCLRRGAVAHHPREHLRLRSPTIAILAPTGTTSPASAIRCSNTPLACASSSSVALSDSISATMSPLFDRVADFLEPTVKHALRAYQSPAWA